MSKILDPHTAQNIPDIPEVQDALKILSKYGMGMVFAHSHNAQGEFTELPKGVAAYEEDLKVTFHDVSTLGLKEGFIPVGWRWNDEKNRVEIMMKCRVAQWCEQPT